MSSLKKDFYFGTLGSFDYDFTQNHFKDNIINEFHSLIKL
jgi:hypothetical protein